MRSKHHGFMGNHFFESRWHLRPSHSVEARWSSFYVCFFKHIKHAAFLYSFNPILDIPFGNTLCHLQPFFKQRDLTKTKEKLPIWQNAPNLKHVDCSQQCHVCLEDRFQLRDWSGTTVAQLMVVWLLASDVLRNRRTWNVLQSIWPLLVCNFQVSVFVQSHDWKDGQKR